jgi:hypothetical protein
MRNYKEYLQYLEARARTGDPVARERFRRTLERDMVPFVRDTLDSGRGTTTLKREVLATADRLARYATGHGPDARERLVRRVATCLSECWVERLGVSLLVTQAMMETACA